MDQGIQVWQWLVGGAAFLIVFILYPSSLSAWRLYRISPLGIVFNRLSWGAAAGVGALILTFSVGQKAGAGATAQASESSRPVAATVKAKPAPDSQQSIVPAPVVQVALPTPPTQVSPPLPQPPEQSPAGQPQQTQVAGSRDAIPPPHDQSISMTPDEVKQMEDRVQYHGSDPFVRRRLGLPPK